MFLLPKQKFHTTVYYDLFRLFFVKSPLLKMYLFSSFFSRYTLFSVCPFVFPPKLQQVVLHFQTTWNMSKLRPTYNWTQWCVVARLMLYASPDDRCLCRNGRKTVEKYFGISSSTSGRVWQEYRDQVLIGVLYPDLTVKKVGTMGRKSQFTPEIKNQVG